MYYQQKPCSSSLSNFTDVVFLFDKLISEEQSVSSIRDRVVLIILFDVEKMRCC